MTQDLGRTVVVTGGTRGFGRELSLAFARRGCQVVALYRADAEAAAKLDEVFAAERLAGRSFRHDVAESNSESGAWSLPEIENAESIALIHNASAFFAPKPIHLLDWEDFEAALDVALKGCWLSALGLLRPMLKRGGGTVVTVLTSALSAAEPPKGFAAYVAAKAALQTFTASLAAEYRARGIRVFSVSPGFMRTSLTERWHPTIAEAVSKSSRSTDPARAAERVVRLVDDGTLAGRGESYDV
jgi:NAD(P)-dependent dehydrogenase (short-subunit alcohol dehydrogenase family)